MATLSDLRAILTKKLGFSAHHIDDGGGKGVASDAGGIDTHAVFLVKTDQGNCYAAFSHPNPTLSEADANRYKAVSLLMPGGPAAYCVVQVGDVLRLFLTEDGHELNELPENYDSIRDAEEMVRELTSSDQTIQRRRQWAEKTLNTESSLSRFVKILEGCWQDIWDIENARNDWIFDEFSRFLFIKLNEDSKPNGAFTLARLDSYCSENAHMGQQAASAFVNQLFDELKARYSEVFTDENEKVLSSPETIRKVVRRLEGINLRDTQGDVLGRAFEIMLSDTFKGTDLGQFFTPREVVHFMMDLARDTAVSPILDLEAHERMLDAVAGSGGFLISVYEDLYRHLMSTNGQPTRRKQMLRRLGRDTIFACEVEEKAARLGKLNLIIHAVDADNARTVHQNYYFNKEYGGLKPEISFKVDFGDERREQRIGPGAIDIVLTNPPFGKAVKRQSILLDYQFGHELKTFKRKPPEKRAKNSQDSEVLFIEHYLRVLKPGGKILISVPYFGPLRVLKSHLSMYHRKPPDLPFFQYGFTSKEFTNFLQKAGFSIEMVKPLYPHRLLLEEIPCYRWAFNQPWGHFIKKWAEWLLHIKDGHMILMVGSKSISP